MCYGEKQVVTVYTSRDVSFSKTFCVLVKLVRNNYDRYKSIRGSVLMSGRGFMRDETIDGSLCCLFVLPRPVVFHPYTATITSPYNGQVRFAPETDTPTSSPSSGRVELYTNEEWKKVCLSSADTAAGDAICKQLGFTQMDRIE